MALIPLPTQSSLASIYAPEDVVYRGTFIGSPSLPAGSPCQVNVFGQIVGCTNSLSSASAVVHGFLAADTVDGQTATLLRSGTFSYQATGITGVDLYLSTVAGRYDDVAAGFSTIPVAKVIFDRSITQVANTRILLWVKRGL